MPAADIPTMTERGCCEKMHDKICSCVRLHSFNGRTKAGTALILSQADQGNIAHLCTLGIQSSESFKQLLPAAVQPLSILCREKQLTSLSSESSVTKRQKHFVTSRWQGGHSPARSELLSAAVSFPPLLLYVPVLAPPGAVPLQSYDGWTYRKKRSMDHTAAVRSTWYVYKCNKAVSPDGHIRKSHRHLLEPILLLLLLAYAPPQAVALSFLPSWGPAWYSKVSRDLSRCTACVEISP